jgi:hypothetical protein
LAKAVCAGGIARIAAATRRATLALVLVGAVVPGGRSQEPGSGWGFIDGRHPICPAWMHLWASGDAGDPGLLTYGTSFARRYHEAVADVATSDDALVGLARGRTSERLAVGPALRGADGPVLAGASTTSTADPDVFLYPGPAEGDAFVAAVRVRGELAPGRTALVLDVDAGADERAVRALGVGVTTGPALFYGGALSARGGPACSGGLVLGGAPGVTVYGLEGIQRQAVALPFVGDSRFGVQVGVQVGVLSEAGPGNRRPFFHSMRIELLPHSDWVIGLNRAVIFGGTATRVPVTLRTVVLMLIGLPDVRGKDSDFENQVASVDARWRTRISSRPALFTLEYGTEDSGRAFVRVPGFRLTGELRAGVTPSSWTGLTLVWLAGSRRPHPPWYRHGALAWGWTDRGLPLGNPLGGKGLAAVASHRFETPTGGLALGAGVVWRGNENLFAPDLEGVRMHGSVTWLLTLGGWEMSSSASADLGGSLAARGSLALVRRLGSGAR